jgi:hypothetical protein
MRFICIKQKKTFNTMPDCKAVKERRESGMVGRTTYKEDCHLSSQVTLLTYTGRHPRAHDVILSAVPIAMPGVHLMYRALWNNRGTHQQ